MQKGRKLCKLKMLGLLRLWQKQWKKDGNCRKRVSTRFYNECEEKVLRVLLLLSFEIKALV